MAHGVDKERVYVRKTEQKIVKDLDFPGLRFDEQNVFVEAFVIGVAGRLFPCVKMHTWRQIGNKHRYLSRVCFNLEQTDTFLQDARKDGFISKKDFEWWQKSRSLPNFFAEVAAIADKRIYFFIENECPVFVAAAKDRSYLEIDEHGKRAKSVSWGREVSFNPPLRDFEFFKVMDAFTIWQEISMFISNSLTKKSPPPAAISDEIMRDMKGFDNHSFKKGPSKQR